MKIYIVSDTHHSNLLIPLYRLFEKADMVIHLGDGFREAQDLAAVLACPVVSVRGNCDYDGKDVQIIEINGHVLFCTHGHLYGADSGRALLARAAEAAGADIVLYGHTHIQEISFYSGRWFINPGSPVRPRGGYQGTYCILTLEKERVYPELIAYKGEN